MSDTLYIKMDQCVEVTESYVTIGDLGKLECKNKTVVNRLKPIKLLNDNSNGKKRYIVSIMKIFEIVDKEFENVDVQSIGETDCIIEFKKANSDNKAFEILKVIGICIKICKLVAGSKNTGKTVMEVSYSIGLAVGILVFYNHFGPKKLSNDPTPIEVEMRKYETEINKALIDGHNRQDGKLDVK